MVIGVFSELERKKGQKENAVILKNGYINTYLNVCLNFFGGLELMTENGLVYRLLNCLFWVGEFQ